MIYFDAYTSDLHHMHENIIKYCGRPCGDVEQMTEMLVNNHNKVVRKNDSVLYLGDIFFGKNDFHARKTFIQRMNGQKYLLRGNHDNKITDKEFYDMGFKFIFKTDFLGEIGIYPVRFSHYPYENSGSDPRYKEQRPPREEGITLVHGHTHEKDRITTYGTIHVGVDAWNYGPAPHDEVVDLLKLVDYNRRHNI